VFALIWLRSWFGKQGAPDAATKARGKRRRSRCSPGVEELEPRVLLADSLARALLLVPETVPHHVAAQGHQAALPSRRGPALLVPGLPGQTVGVRFTWTARDAQFNNELGLFFVDSAKGQIGRLLPGEPGYAAAALARAHSRVIFASGQTVGASRSLDLPSGRYVSFYLIQNGTTAQWRAQNPGNSLGQRPVAVFSFLPANPDGRVHMRWLPGSQFTWDDGGDAAHDFGDLNARVRLGTPRGQPSNAGGGGGGVSGGGGGGGSAGGGGTRGSSCAFAPADWVAGQDGGSASGHGTAGVANCAATLREGDSFDVTLSHTFTVPAQPSLLSFTFDGPAFDTTARNAIKDAFEAALVGGTSQPLVHTFRAGRDAFFNVSEAQAAATGAGTTFDGHTVTTDLSGLVPGSTATLIFRLVNNDGDTNTRVNLTDFRITPGGQGTPVIATPQLAAAASAPAVDFSLLSDVSSSFTPQYARTSFDQDTQTLHTDLTVRDSGTYTVGGPLVVAVSHLSDPSVRVVNAAGVTPDGLPYFVYPGPGGADVVQPGDVTGTQTVSFFNPGRVPFTYDLVVLAALNQPPAFTSQPNTEAIPGVPYVYQAAAADNDHDPLTFSLLSGPAGMAVEPATGKVTWSPQQGDLGNQAVALRVDDGRGATAEQDFTLPVTVAPPNQPPVFTSTPVVDGNVNTAYTYQATARDLDGDPLTFAVVSGPKGLTINPSSGLVQWTPTADQLGPDAVSLQVSDGRGGTATQVYTIGVEQQKGNLPPAIVSQPVTTAAVGQDYQYPVKALDADNDPLTYSLTTAPPGMTIDPATGLVRVPAADIPQLLQAQPVPVTVRVDDGRGGFDTQSYTLNVQTVQPGEIEGTKFNDLNGNGIRDVQGGSAAPLPVDNVPGTADPYLAGQPDGATADSGDSAPAESPVLASGVTLTPGTSLMFTVLAGTANGQSSPDGGGQVSHPALNGISGLDAPSGALVGVFLGANAPDPSSPPATLNFFDTASVPGGTDYPNLSPQLGQVFFIGDGRTSKGDVQQVVVPAGATRLYLATMAAGPWHGNTGSLAVEVAPFDPTSGPAPITLTPIATNFNNLIHVDYYEPNNTLIASVNYSGGQPRNFEEIKPDGSHVPFSNVSGFTDEVYIAIARSSDLGGFKPGDLFVGNGKDGQIARITDGGQTVINPWVTLPGTGHGLFRGYLTFDRTGVFDGDLIAETNQGEVWRINAAGQATEIGNTHSFLEGVEVIPNDPARYGPLAGTVLATDENSSGFYSITPAGQVTFHDIGVSGLEDSHVIPANQNFFGADYGNGRVLAIRAGQLAPLVGDILFTQEFGGGLFRLFWDGQALQVQRLDLAMGSTSANQWEGSQFAPAGVAPLPPVPVEPGLPNWTIYLDLNHNGKLDPGEPSTSTDASGHYAFTNLLPGTYTVAEVGQPGWRQTSPTGGGTHTVTVLSGQVTSAVDFGNTQLNVPSGSRNPAFTSTAQTTATVGQLYRYDATVSNPDGATLTFDLPAHPAGMGVDTATGVVFWFPTADEVEPQTVVLRVQDGNGRVALQSFRVTVSPATSAPVITSVPPPQPVVGVPYQYRVHAQDAAGNPFTFTLDTGPAGMSIDATGLVSYTPAAGQVGTQHVHLTVDNGHGGQAVQQFDLAVVATAPNDPPVISSSPRTVVRLGSNYVYAVQASDPDGDALTYSLGTAPAGMTIDATGVIRWTPTAAEFGPNAVSVTVTDARGLAAPAQSFTVSVISQTVNHPPAITSTPRPAATLGHLYRYDATASDPDGDPVVWSLLRAPAGMSIDPMRGTVRWTPTADELGPQEVEVQAQDPLLATATQDFTVTVRSVDVPPVIVSEPPTQAVTGAAYTYAVQATDAENDPLTYTLPAAPAGMTVDAGGVIHWTPAANEVGPQAVLVQVDDGQGGTATQAYQVVVTDQAGNQAPAIASTAPLAATVGGAYQYPVVATDPDGDKVAFALISAPAGMSIDTATGLVQWTPTAAEAGTNLVAITASDPAGAQGLQRFAVTVKVNQPPQITSTPPATVTAGLAYRYDVQAHDPDGDHLTYALTNGPAGMALEPSSGRLTWSPGIPDIGTHHVVVTVIDNPGATATQAFDVNVVADTEAPKVSVAVSASRVNVGSDVAVTLTATDNVKVAGITLTVGGRPVGLDTNGSATVKLDTVGAIDVVGTATDPAGNVGTAKATVRVIDPTETGGPTVQITGPATNTTVTTSTQITGTVTDPHLESYQVQYAPFDQVDLTDLANSTASWVTFAQGTAPVTNGVLGTFDPTMLMNDAYVVRVLAQNVNGNVTAQGVVLSVSASLKLGDFTHGFTDLSVPVAGVPVQVTRIYDTMQSGQSGDFGFGWRLGIQDANLHKTVPPSPGGLFGLFSAFPFKATTKVYLTNPSGMREGFTFDPTPQPTLFGTIWHPHFQPDPGVYDQLSADDIGLEQAADGFRFFLFGFAYNPDEFTLTTKDQVSYRYSDLTGLEKITDPNGNTITFTPAGITSSAGPAVVFQRDAQGRIAEIDDPADNAIRYQYDANGDLSATTNQAGLTTHYAYLSNPAHYLTTVTDPLGNKVLSPEYDAQGRLQGVKDALGNTATNSYDMANSTETVRDALGNVTTLVYDQRGNVVSRTDPQGATTLYEFADPANPDQETKVTDPRGNVTRTTYDARGNVTSVTDPGGGVMRTTYDAANMATSMTDALGRTATEIYDDKGNLVRVVDAVGAATTFAFDSRGRIVSLTDAAGNTTTQAYAAGAGPSTITRPDGSFRTYEYNEFGEVTKFVNEDKQTTTYTYDAVGRLASRQDPGGGVTTLGYDAAGNRTSITDPLGNRTTFVYDASQRLVRETDPLGNTTTDTYDAAGNLTDETDPDGRTRHYVFDKAGRIAQEVWMQGGAPVRTIAYTYDPAGNLLTATDPDSALTYTYDTLNRVATASNAGTPGAPTYVLTSSYDAAGNPLSVTDNTGVQVASTYNPLNLVTSRTWQGPGVGPARVDFSYDATGLLAQESRFSDLGGVDLVGRTVTARDDQGRVQSITNTDAAGAALASYSYRYDPAGLLAGATIDGQTATYHYDNAGQLTGVDHGNGPSESYAYDLNGNRVGAGYTVGPGNHTRSDGTSTYDYDADGNLVRQTDIATGAVTTYTYDFRNRLVEVAQRDANGKTLTDVRYVYDALDRRIARIADTTVYTVYNRANAWADVDATGKVVAQYLFGDRDDQLLARSRPGEGTSWYLTDRQGSVVDLTDAHGQLLNHTDYASFGNILRQSNPAEADRYAFMGREFDAQGGGYNFRNRVLLPAIGRFTTADPLGFGASDPNLYRFVNNSPLNFLDPTGTDAIAEEATLLERISTAVSTIIECVGEEAVLNIGQAGIYLLLAPYLGPAVPNVYVGRTVDYSIRLSVHEATGIGGRGLYSFKEFFIPLSEEVIDNPETFRTVEQLVINAFNPSGNVKAELLNKIRASKNLFCV
jgi:RHS repeat-associated protein